MPPLKPEEQSHFSHDGTQHDVEALGLFLRDALASANVSLRPSSSVKILNLACGRSDETKVLFDILAPCAEARELLGVDIRQREIAEASQRWNTLEHGDASFIVHDGTQIGTLDAAKEGFDFAFMRHQNFWNGDTTWMKIYDQALHALKPEGLLIITSYFDREHLLAVEALQSLGALLLLSWRNPRSRMIDARIKKSADRHLAIFRLPCDSSPAFNTY